MGPEQTYEFSFAQHLFEQSKIDQVKLSKNKNPEITHSFIKIDEQPIQIDSYTGHGSYAKVKKGLTKENQKCAIKISGVPAKDGSFYQTCIDTEISLLQRLGRLMGYGTQLQIEGKAYMGELINHKTYIVSTFWDGPELFKYLQDNVLTQAETLRVTI